MKNNVWSMLIIMCSFMSLQMRATVYAFAALKKGEQSIYFLADVQENSPYWDVQKNQIATKTRDMNALLIIDKQCNESNWVDAINSLKSETVVCGLYEKFADWQELSAFIECEILLLTPGRYDESPTLKPAWERLQNMAAEASESNYRDPSWKKAYQDARRTVLTSLYINRLLSEIEQCADRPIIVCSSPQAISAVLSALQRDDWVEVANNITLFLKQALAYNKRGLNEVKAARACGKPINNIEAVISFLEQTGNDSGAASSQPVQSVEGSSTREQIVQSSRSWSTADVAVCGLGIVSVAVLACIAIKNNFWTALKKMLDLQLLVRVSRG